MHRTRMTAALAALLVALHAVSAVEKQIKLEDIERDNLQTELLKQRGRAEQQQQQQQQQPAYHSQHLHHQQHHHQHHQHSAPDQPEQGFTYQHHSPPQQHYRFEHPVHQPQQLQQLHHLQHLQPERHAERPHLQLYQTAAASAAAPTHIMYLIMPNGNVAALQLAPHPNQIQTYYSPAKQMFGTLYHQLHAGQQLGQLGHLGQHTLVPMLQVYQPPVTQYTAPQAQRYQPSLSFNSAQAHQLHAQHFRELSGEPAPSAPGSPAAAAVAVNPEISTYSGAQSPHSPHSLQSHKSLFGAGVKSTAAPPLKGSFSTQTGQSYANFRQYG